MGKVTANLHPSCFWLWLEAPDETVSESLMPISALRTLTWVYRITPFRAVIERPEILLLVDLEFPVIWNISNTLRSVNESLSNRNTKGWRRLHSWTALAAIWNIRWKKQTPSFLHADLLFRPLSTLSNGSSICVSTHAWADVFSWSEQQLTAKAMTELYTLGMFVLIWLQVEQGQRGEPWLPCFSTWKLNRGVVLTLKLSSNWIESLHHTKRSSPRVLYVDLSHHQLLITTVHSRMWWYY